MKDNSLYARFQENCTVERLVNGRTLVTKTGSIPEEDYKHLNGLVRYSAENPRLLTQIKESDGKITQAKIEDFLEDDRHETYYLLEGLQASGRSWDSILLVDAGSHFDTSEGNRRLWAYRRSVRDGKSLGPIPVEILPPETTPEDICSIVSLRHIAHQKEWDSISQARECARLKDDYDWSIKEIATHLQRTPQKVSKYIRAYHLLRDYQDGNPNRTWKTSGDYDPKNFTKFWKLVCSNLNKRIDNEAGLFSWFCTLVQNKKIGHCPHVSKFPEILKNPKATAILETHGSLAAIKYIEDIGVESRVVRMSEKLVDAMDDISLTESQSLRNGSLEAQDKITKLQSCSIRLQQLLVSLQMAKAA